MSKWQHDFTVEISECDVLGRWKPSAILTRMQEASEAHAEEMGFSRPFLLDAGMCWVLYRQRVTLHRHVSFGQRLTLTTWPTKDEGIFFPRYFHAQTLEGEPVMDAETAWVLINIHTRRPLRPSALPGTVQAEAGEYSPLPGMLTLPPDAVPLEVRRVRWSELDVNGHMNNVRYADWLCDALDNERLQSRGLSAWQLNYTTEALWNEEVSLSIADFDDRVLLAGTRVPDGRAVFQAEAVFGKQDGG